MHMHLASTLSIEGDDMCNKENERDEDRAIRERLPCPSGYEMASIWYN
jgi:hypothetical protein